MGFLFHLAHTNIIILQFSYGLKGNWVILNCVMILFIVKLYVLLALVNKYRFITI